LGSVVSVTANITGGNILTGGLISSTGNITGGNLLTGGVISSTGNITGGNISTGGLLIASNNLIVNSPSPQAEGGQLILAWANITATGQANSTWNIDVDGTNNLRAFYQNAAGATGVLLQASPTSNVLSFPSTAGISAAGNVTGNYFIGNGSQLTGISAGSGNSITNGTSNVVVAASGNVTVAVANTSPVATFATTGIYVPGLISATGNISGGNVLTAGLISSTANITGGNVLTGGLISATSTITSAANITGGNIITAGLITASGNVNVLANVNIGNANSVSWANTSGIRAYTYYNNATASLDTVFL
jgi:hypothetical protein